MLEAAGGVAGFVLEVQLDLGKTRQGQRDQVCVGTALEVSLDDTDCFTCPLTVIVHGPVPKKFDL
ncbi:hypothetical protein D3C80_668840 [compost metagenome]